MIDNATALDPLRRPFCRSWRLEDPKGQGVRVVGLDGQQAVAYMEATEAKALSEEATRLAWEVVVRAAANMPGGCHMFRVGDGAHAMHPRSRSIGKATAWAVYRGPWVWPAEARNLRPRRGAPPPHASGDAWKAE